VDVSFGLPFVLWHHSAAPPTLTIRHHSSLFAFRHSTPATSSDSSSPNIPSVLPPTIVSNLPVLRPAVCATQRQFRSFIHSSRTMGDVVKIMPRSNLLSHRVTLKSLLLAYLDPSASNYSRGTKSYLVTELLTMMSNTAIFVNEVHSGHS
jgi:hypothetical protein